MGQRLEITIYKGYTEETLANAYYHWSAYTSSAMELARDVVLAIQKGRIKQDDDVRYAIKLLEKTGAGLTYQEKQYLKTDDKYKGCRFKQCHGRNEGLIAVSPEGKQETRNWQEGQVIIDIDTQQVMFDVWATYDDEELKEYYPDEKIEPVLVSESPDSWKTYDEFLDMVDDYRAGKWYKYDGINFKGIE